VFHREVSKISGVVLNAPPIGVQDLNTTLLDLFEHRICIPQLQKLRVKDFADGMFFSRASVGRKSAFVNHPEFHDIDSNSARKATVSTVLAVGFSHARYPSGNRTPSFWMWHAATVALFKA
jgi:hypothetical protein